MTNPKPAVTAIPTQGYPLHWEERPEVEQVLADEAIVQVAADRVYVTVGQVQIPLGTALADKPASLEITPVARLVFTTASFHKIAKAMASVSEQLQKMSAKKEEDR